MKQQRLIDADALIPMMKYATTDSEIGVFPIKIGFNAITEVINNAPTIDAELVRHGKWEMKPDPFGFFDEIPVCSECGCTTKMREKTKYCPHCGARMDKDEWVY